MPIFRYFTVVGSALLVLLFVCDAYTNDDSSSRFNGSLFESATYAPRADEIVAKEEQRFTRYASAAGRVKDVFAQFVPNEGRRGKRYSSLGTIIR
jgi:hypothetical protein